MRIEDRVKEHLSTTLTQVHASPDAWSSIERRVAGRARRDQTARIGTALVTLALVAAGLTALWSVFRTERRQAGPAGTSTESQLKPRVGATIPVGPKGQVTSAVFGAGSLWVASFEEGVVDGSVARIDPATDRVVAEIPIQAVPGWETGGEGTAFGADSIWLTGGNGDQALLQRIDPSTNRATLTVLPGGMGADVVVGESAVWVSVTDTASSHPDVRLVRVDPSSNEVVATIPVEGDWIREVFAFPDAVVVRTLDRETSVITVVDPSTNRVVSSRRLASLDGPFAQDTGVLWAGTGRKLVRLDPHTAEPIGDPLPVGRNVSWQASLLAGVGGIWFLGYDPGDTGEARSIERYNHGAGEVDLSVTTPYSPIAMVMGADSIWVLNYEGSVTRIHLR